MLVDIGGNRWGVSELLQAVYYKPVMYPLRFCRSFEFKYFWFPRFGRTEAPMGVGFRGVRWGISDFLQIAIQSP